MEKAFHLIDSKILTFDINSAEMAFGMWITKKEFGQRLNAANPLPRGQFYMSVRVLASDLNISDKVARRLIKQFAEMEIIRPILKSNNPKLGSIYEYSVQVESNSYIEDFEEEKEGEGTVEKEAEGTVEDTVEEVQKGTVGNPPEASKPAISEGAEVQKGTVEKGTVKGTKKGTVEGTVEDTVERDNHAGSAEAEGTVKGTVKGTSKKQSKSKVKNNIERKGTVEMKNTYDNIINNYTIDSELKMILVEFIKMRKLIKKPMTDFALKRLLNKLDKLSDGSTENKIAILEQSILNSWQDVYSLKTNNFNTNKSSYGNAKNNKYQVNVENKANSQAYKPFEFD